MMDSLVILTFRSLFDYWRFGFGNFRLIDLYNYLNLNLGLNLSVYLVYHRLDKTFHI